MALIQTSNDAIEYHKIDTIFERKTDFSVSETLKHPVIGTIDTWDVTEKIGGTNIRVILTADGDVKFGGRTNNAQIPGDLLNLLVRKFTPALMKEVFWREAPVSAVVFGEGYGAGIERGGAYRPDKAFTAYDVLVDGKWWMERSQLLDIAENLGMDTVPYLGRMNLSRIVEYVREGFPSKIGGAPAEGIVARPIETLFDRRGERLIIKLKTKDFRPGKR